MILTNCGGGMRICLPGSGPRASTRGFFSSMDLDSTFDSGNVKSTDPEKIAVTGIDLLTRPIHRCTADRGRAQILLCLLAYYVERHLRQAWEPLLFEDEELVVDRNQRDPAAPA